MLTNMQGSVNPRGPISDIHSPIIFQYFCCFVTIRSPTIHSQNRTINHALPQKNLSHNFDQVSLYLYKIYLYITKSYFSSDFYIWRVHIRIATSVNLYITERTVSYYVSSPGFWNVQNGLSKAVFHFD